jgi:delta 1-pyrroline-5-carboxylate dehydrogenase
MTKVGACQHHLVSHSRSGDEFASYFADPLEAVLDEIAATGSSGIHSRIEETAHYILARLRVGNS